MYSRERVAADLDEPREPRGIRPLVDHPAVEDLQPRLLYRASAGLIAMCFAISACAASTAPAGARLGAGRNRHVLQRAARLPRPRDCPQVHDQFAGGDRHAVAHLLQPDVLLAQRVQARQTHRPNISPTGQAERLAVEIGKSKRTGFRRCARDSRQQEAITGPRCERHQTMLGGARADGQALAGFRQAWNGWVRTDWGSCPLTPTSPAAARVPVRRNADTVRRTRDIETLQGPRRGQQSA